MWWWFIPSEGQRAIGGLLFNGIKYGTIVIAIVLFSAYTSGELNLGWVGWLAISIILGYFADKVGLL
jgi:hypothetical protein